MMKEKEKKLQKENFRSLKQTYKRTQKIRSQSQERKRSDAARLRTSDTLGVREVSAENRKANSRLVPLEVTAPHPLRLNTEDSFSEKDNTLSLWTGGHKAGEGRGDSPKIKASWLLIFSMLRSPAASLTYLY